MPPMLTEVALEVPSEFWFVFWLTFPEVPTAACPLELPVLPTALMVVVAPPLPPDFPPRFWIRTPRTSPLLLTTLLPLPLLTTPVLAPPTLTPLLAHCPLCVSPLIWFPELAELVPFALPVLLAAPAVVVTAWDPPAPPAPLTAPLPVPPAPPAPP